MYLQRIFGTIEAPGKGECEDYWDSLPIRWPFWSAEDLLQHQLLPAYRALLLIANKIAPQAICRYSIWPAAGRRQFGVQLRILLVMRIGIPSPGALGAE